MKSVKYKVGEIYMNDYSFINIIISVKEHNSYSSYWKSMPISVTENKHLQFTQKQRFTSKHTRVSYEEEAI